MTGVGGVEVVVVRGVGWDGSATIIGGSLPIHPSGNGYVGVVVGVMGMKWVGWIGWIWGSWGL